MTVTSVSITPQAVAGAHVIDGGRRTLSGVLGRTTDIISSWHGGISKWP